MADEQWIYGSPVGLRGRSPHAPSGCPRPGGRRTRTAEVTAIHARMKSVDLARIAWLMTVAACLIAVAILVLQGYFGYAAVTFAVAISAAINLF